MISSVVPQLSPVLKAAVQLTSPVPVMQIGPGVKTGLNIRIDNPAQLGADFVAAAVGAFEKYPLPVIIVDFGTATKISIVDRSRSFIGGSIMPGVRVSLDALSNRAAQLPHISLEPPAPVIGTNTIDCMKSGVLLGNASMIDGMIERYEEKAGPAASIVATGESVDAVAPFCRHKLLVDKTLRLDGLYAVWKKNTGM